MELATTLYMNGSLHGVNSYANNSTVQSKVIMKTKPLIEQTIKTMHLNKSLMEKCFVMADMGCSAGPNTFLPLSHAIGAIEGLCESPPQLQVFLNDLPGNDFNFIFRSVSDLYDSLPRPKGRVSPSCYISGTAGSFYGRLFPTSSLDFVYSSASLHFLSQALKITRDTFMWQGQVLPRYLKHIGSNSRGTSLTFLSHRAREVKPNRGMVLVLMGRSDDDPSAKDGCLFWELLSKSLVDMVVEGRIKESDVESFNVPFYSPSKEELEKIIERQGSFNIERIDNIEENYDYDDVEENENYVFDKKKSGQNVASYIRAVAESMLTSHFGSEVIEDIFGRYAEVVGEHLSTEETKFLFLAISMTKNN